MLDLNALEREALRAYRDTYGIPYSADELVFVQRGIDAMRFAVAKAQGNTVQSKDH